MARFYVRIQIINIEAAALNIKIYLKKIWKCYKQVTFRA